MSPEIVHSYLEVFLSAGSGALPTLHSRLSVHETFDNTRMTSDRSEEGGDPAHHIELSVVLQYASNSLFIVPYPKSFGVDEPTSVRFPRYVSNVASSLRGPARESKEDILEAGCSTVAPSPRPGDMLPISTRDTLLLCSKRLLLLPPRLLAGIVKKPWSGKICILHRL